MNLLNFFKANPKAAIAYSGGVDSSYLLYAAVKYKADVTAYYVKSVFQPQFEINDAKKLANQLGVRLKILQVDILNSSEVSDNPLNRCYYCKKQIFNTIKREALKDGYHVLLDGTNASDDEKERPGMRVLMELSVHSPLKGCGLTKEDIRLLSKECGLFTWNKPAYACLATRISTGERITKDKLYITEKAEDYLFNLGFCDFRIRMIGDNAKIEIRETDLLKLIENRDLIVKELKKYYKSITLDLETRK